MSPLAPPPPARAALQWTTVGALTSVTLPAAAGLSRLHEPSAWRLMRLWSQAALRTFDLSLSIEDHSQGVYNDPPYLFVHLNQTSLLETFVYCAALPKLVRIVMNIEFAMIPVLGPSMVLMGSKVVIRQRPAQAKKVMEQVAQQMRERKRSFGMSIEGKRSPDGQLSPFKKGAAVLAISAQARVVPFFIYGTREALPMGAWRVRSQPLRAVTFAPIDARGLRFEDRNALTDQLRRIADREQTKVKSPNHNQAEPTG